MEQSGPSRRTILGKGAVALVGAVGLSHMTPASASPIAEGIPFSFTGRFFRLVGPNGFGQFIQPGERANGFGELLDPATGEKIGEFYSSAYNAAAPFGEGPAAAALVEEHTLTFADGTIFGSGTRPSIVDPDGTYAIIGGTKRYVALKGTYTARLDFVELGGDGSAAFALSLDL